jgi:hypothetical protein
VWSRSPAWLEAPLAGANRTRQAIVSELMKIRLVPRSRARANACSSRPDQYSECPTSISARAPSTWPGSWSIESIVV